MEPVKGKVGKKRENETGLERGTVNVREAETGRGQAQAGMGGRQLTSHTALLCVGNGTRFFVYIALANPEANLHLLASFYR